MLPNIYEKRYIWWKLKVCRLDISNEVIMYYKIYYKRYLTKHDTRTVLISTSLKAERCGSAARNGSVSDNLILP